MDELIKEFGDVFELRGHAGKFNIKSTYSHGIMGEGSQDDRRQVIVGKLIENGPNYDYLRCSLSELRKYAIIIDPLLMYPDPVFSELKIEEDSEIKSIQEYFVKELMENFPDASECSALRCSSWKYKLCEYTFVDDEAEEQTHYKIDLEKLLKAIPLLFSSKWGCGLTKVPRNAFASKDNAEDLLCNFDSYDLSAFVQLAIFGEVVYG